MNESCAALNGAFPIRIQLILTALCLVPRAAVGCRFSVCHIYYCITFCMLPTQRVGYGLTATHHSTIDACIVIIIIPPSSSSFRSLVLKVQINFSEWKLDIKRKYLFKIIRKENITCVIFLFCVRTTWHECHKAKHSHFASNLNTRHVCVLASGWAGDRLRASLRCLFVLVGIHFSVIRTNALFVVTSGWRPRLQVSKHFSFLSLENLTNDEYRFDALRCAWISSENHFSSSEFVIRRKALHV